MIRIVQVAKDSARRYLRELFRNDELGILELKVTPAVRIHGATVRVSWSVRGSWRVRIQPGGDNLVSRGSLTLLAVSGDQQLVLTAWGIARKVSRQITVSVLPAPDLSEASAVGKLVPSSRTRAIERLVARRTIGVMRLRDKFAWPRIRRPTLPAPPTAY